VAILLEFYTLWRSLRLEDDEVIEYRKTLRWFAASVILLIASLVLAQIWSVGQPSDAAERAQPQHFLGR
jgi:hypothetical protein